MRTLPTSPFTIAAQRRFFLLLTLAASTFLTACITNPTIQNATGVSSTDLDPSRKGMVSGIGVESQDYNTMSDLMVRDLLSDSYFAGLATSGKRPRIIVDSARFVNEGAQAINKNMITERLMIGLNRAARQRLQFVNREESSMMEEERNLKRSGTVDTGTMGLTKTQLSADFRMSGKIMTQDSRNNKTGLTERNTVISFRLNDLESGEMVWTGIYELKRASADDVVYR